MIKIFLTLLLSTSLFAVTIVNQNIYEKEDSVDIMLSFDSPYEGKIIQKREGERRVFILKDTNIGEKVTKDIDSYIVQKLQLIPYQNQLFIELSGLDDFEVDASKTVDNYGLRLRIRPLTALNKEPLDFEKEVQKIETKKEDNIGSAYLKVLLVLAVLIGFLYLFKNWLLKRGGKIQGNWLFDKSAQREKSDIKIVQQKGIDVKNRVALIAYKEKEYLVLLGNSNVVLDSFDTKHATTQNDFDEVLAENEDQLSDFMKLKNKKFNDYKKKTSL